MNEVEKQIYDIIKNIVCGFCGCEGNVTCSKHRNRCLNLYRKESEEIYKDVVQPIIEKVC